MKALILLVIILGGALRIYAQDLACKQEWPDHVVRSVTIKARWLPEVGPSQFQSKDLRNPTALLAKWKQEIALTRHLLKRFSPDTVALITQYTPPKQPKPELINAVVKDLNKVLSADLLFEKDAFAGVSIRPDTQILFEQKPSGGEGLFRLNRMLLEDAYPTELAKDQKIYLALHRGAPFTPDNLSASRLGVIRAINQQKERFNSEFILLGKLPLVDVNLVTACGREVPAATCQKDNLTDKCVDVEIHPYAVSTDPAFMGSILLPLPRSNRFTFLGEVPGVLRFLNPKFGLDRDDKLGTTPHFDISTDLLNLKNVVAGDAAEGKRASLLLKAKGARSIEQRFYNIQSELSLLWRQPNKHVESLGLTASFKADSQPELKSVHHSNALQLGAHIVLTPELGLLNRVALDAEYRRAAQRFSSDSSVPAISAKEDSLQSRALFEARIFNGFSRLGVWFEHAKPDNLKRPYQRYAGLFGYEKEIPVGEHTVGVEAILGLGHASANTPAYALFYGGNSLQTFLYEEGDDLSLRAMPAGPLLRSFGKNQAGFVTGGKSAGANSYRHFNLNISIPIPKLSAPLIPDEVVIDQPRKTLRNLIAFAVNTGQEALSSNLQDEGLSEQEADKQAAKVFSQIRPGIKFLSDYGKIYSVKPLIMFDSARLTHSGFNDAQIRTSFGGGIQLTIVIAKFELGYMRTMHRLPGDGRGNFVMRLVFENLF